MLVMPRALAPIYGITLLDVLAYTIMIPLLSEIAAKYHASEVVVGSLLTVTALCSTISAPVWGWLSDRFGRKRAVLASQLFSLAGYVLLAIAPNLSFVFISRAIAGSGGGSLGVAQSYITDVTTPEQRDPAFALFGALFGVGFVLGPIVGGTLAHFGLGIPFFFAAFFEVLNLAFTYRFLPTTIDRVPHHGNAKIRDVVEAIRRPQIGSLLVRQLLFIFAVTYFLANLSFYVKHVLATASSFTTGWLLAEAGVIGGVTFVVLTALVRRVGNAVVSQIGFALAFFAYLALAAVRGPLSLAAVVFIWAAGAALAEPTLTTLLSEAAPADERGAILGLGDSTNNIALMCAPALGAYVIGLDARLAGLIPAVAILAAFAAGWRAMLKERRLAARKWSAGASS